jgi:hypothetical protein
VISLDRQKTTLREVGSRTWLKSGCGRLRVGGHCPLRGLPLSGVSPALVCLHNVNIEQHNCKHFPVHVASLAGHGLIHQVEHPSARDAG